MNNNEFTIITFYQFKEIKDPKNLVVQIKNLCFFNKVRGTVIIAREGINGTLAGHNKQIKLIEKKLIESGFKDIQLKKSTYQFMPFNRLKVKSKKEIVTFDGNFYDVENYKAKYIDSRKWNDFINDKNTVVVDVRNDFEYKMGTFKNSINPKTKNFSEFKKYADQKLIKHKDKNIAMFCTGGIRCEKAASYMSKKGFKKIYQLKGGVLQYLKDVQKEKSSWTGECFVFDNRVSVKNELKDGSYSLCHGCRYPISIEDTKSNKFEEGVTCPNCFNELTQEKKNKLRERNKQIRISKKKGLYNPYIKLSTSDF